VKVVINAFSAECVHPAPTILCDAIRLMDLEQCFGGNFEVDLFREPLKESLLLRFAAYGVVNRR
jgi:hypothetical protein